MKKINKDLFEEEGGLWQYNVCLNYHHDTWPVMRRGYRTAIDLLVDDINKSTQNLDKLVFPIIYLYRHYIELTLKEIILKCCSIRYYKDLFANVREKPNLKYHSLEKLWTRAKEKLMDVVDDPQPKECDFDIINNTLTRYNKRDPNSDTFRYPIDTKNTKHLESMTNLDLGNFIEQIEATISLLDKYLDTVYHILDYYNENCTNE